MRQIGSFRWADGKDFSINCACDAAAVNNPYVMAISVIDYTQNIKAFRAALWTMASKGVSQGMQFDGFDWDRPPGGRLDYRLYPYAYGYTMKMHRLGGTAVHAVFKAKCPGLIMGSSEEALWAELNKPQYTTPLLKSWMPWIRQQLIHHGLLKQCHSFGCTAAVVRISEQGLDSIVEEGLRDGHLEIREKSYAYHNLAV